MNQPALHLIAGPNGAGKTTFARRYLPEFAHCDEFLNADLIAAGLSPFAIERAAPLAGRLLLQRMDALVANQITFGLETTLAGRTYAGRFARIRASGYRIQATFLWLPHVDIARERVANRVKQGGHHVPEDDITRRYQAGIENLFNVYLPHIDELWILNGLAPDSDAIAGHTASGWEIRHPLDFASIQKQAGLT